MFSRRKFGIDKEQIYYKLPVLSVMKRWVAEGWPLDDNAVGA